MPVPVDERVKFFVFVVESPSAADIYLRRSEGELIRNAVQLNGIGCELRTAINVEAFVACLRVGMTEAMATFPGHVPLLHISAHGDRDGIQLSDGAILTWAQLKELLRPVNEAFNGGLVICMSSCDGYSGIRMSMDLQNPQLPYFALVGCADKATWAETAVGYATFYHQLYRGEHIAHAVKAMNIASGREDFYLRHAETSRKNFVEYMEREDAGDAQRNLERLNVERPVTIPSDDKPPSAQTPA